MPEPSSGTLEHTNLLDHVDPEHVPSEYDHTFDGFVQLLGEEQVTQTALARDFVWWASKDREQLEATAKLHIDAINAERKERGAEPIDIKKTSVHYLAGWSRPKWSDYFPASGDDDAKHKWEAFKGQFPRGMQLNLEDLRTLHTKVEILKTDENLQAEFTTAHSERVQNLRAAAMWRSANRKIAAAGKEMALIRIDAGRTGRPLAPAERRRLETLATEQTAYRESQRNVPLTKEVQDALYRAANIDRKRELDSGLLRTEQMEQIIGEALPALSRGEPVLFVGETGGAKTALAEYISKTYFDAEPELVSGYGDVNSYQLMGKPAIAEQNGASVSIYEPGPTIRAMEKGVPLILDEINAMPPEMLKRLNKIMQMRPGDTFTVQEDSGRRVTIQPGFCVIATANEKSKRYKGVEDLSTEFQNRFGANIYRVRYPDHDVPYGDVPTENALLAQAAVIDKHGNMPEDLDLEDLFNFVKACHVSQQVFTGNFGEGFKLYQDVSRHVDNKPGLDETVLAPRTMVAILNDVSRSYGQVTLGQSLHRFVDGIKNPNDRQVMYKILVDHGLLPPAN